MKIMMGEMRGKMAREAAKCIIDTEGFELIPEALAGPKDTQKEYRIIADSGEFTVSLIPFEDREECIEKAKEKYYGIDVVVYFAALEGDEDMPNKNAEFYKRHGLNAVIDTTGMKRSWLEETLRCASPINAVVVNGSDLAIEIAAFEAEMQDFANQYKNEWLEDLESGLYIRESHEGVDVPNNFPGKAYISGTTEAMVDYFNKIGIKFDIKDIAKIRDREDQHDLKVPEWVLDCHDWYRYKVYTSEKNSEIIRNLFDRIYGFLSDDPIFIGKGYRVDESKLSGRQDVGLALVSRDSDLTFRVEHRKGETKIDLNVNGTGVYKTGIIAALKYVGLKGAAGERGTYSTMIDVLNRIDVLEAK